ncbi:hypothetical protein MXB_2031 [Myxobolus squamalis]|nr:hypothetical protein MXB_2031 [Myxobolus squamalis]
MIVFPDEMYTASAQLPAIIYFTQDFKIFGDKLTPRLQRLVQCKHCKRVIANRTFDLHLIKFHPTKFSNLPIANLINQELNNQNCEDFMIGTDEPIFQLNQQFPLPERSRSSEESEQKKLKLQNNFLMDNHFNEDCTQSQGDCTPMNIFNRVRGEVVVIIRESNSAAKKIEDMADFDHTIFLTPTLKQIEERRIAAERLTSLPCPVENAIQPIRQSIPPLEIPQASVVPVPKRTISDDFDPELFFSKQRIVSSPITRPAQNVTGSYARSNKPNQSVLNQNMPYSTVPQLHGSIFPMNSPMPSLDTRIIEKNDYMADSNQLNDYSQCHVPVQGNSASRSKYFSEGTINAPCANSTTTPIS